MNWTINQTVDLSRGYTPVVWPDALMVSGDVGAHTWRLTVLDNGNPVDLSDATITGSFLRADGNMVLVPGTVSGNIASITLTDVCYAVEGKMKGTIKMTKSGAVITLAAVIFTVSLFTSGSVIDPGVAYADFQIDASPAGTYADLAALIAADPDHSKIYITLDDGKWCYYNGSVFVAGGVYQAVSVADNSVSFSNLKPTERKVLFIPNTKTPCYDISRWELDFKSEEGNQCGFLWGDNQTYLIPVGEKVVDESAGYGLKKLIFDTSSKTISFRVGSYTLNQNELIVGTYFLSATASSWSMPFKVINGTDQPIYQFYFTPSSILPDFNTTTEILDFKSCAGGAIDNAGIYYDNEWYWLPANTTVSLELPNGQDTSNKMLIFNKDTKQFYMRAYTHIVQFNELLIGTHKRSFINQSNKWELPFDITINGGSDNRFGVFDYDEQIEDFCELFNGAEGDVLPFVFFTDPHSFNHVEGEATFRESLKAVEFAYKNTPTSFVACGGDWTDMAHSAEESCIILGKINAVTRDNFDNYICSLGNHDNVFRVGESGSGALTLQKTANLLYREYGKTYFSYKSGNTQSYVLDTGGPWELAINSYRQEQLNWFAQKLKEDDCPHSILFMHMGWDTYDHALLPMTDEVTRIAAAYNSRAIIVVDGVPVDFSSCTGKFSFVMTGHMHDEDYDALINGIRVVTTMHSYKTTPPTFDLCLVDYAAQKLKTVRIGFGNNRSIDIS